MEIVELTEDTWPLIEGLFSASSTTRWCFCTWFMQTDAQMDENGPEGNRAVLRDRACAGRPLGLMAVVDGQARAWVAVAPRADYSRLTRSRIAALPDPAEDVSGIWSVTCFYVHRDARGSGITAPLLDAAVDFAKRGGARVVEGYPVDTAVAKKASADLYHGTLGMFLGAGFDLVERRGKQRALVRRKLA